MTAPFATIDDVQSRLAEVDYVCGRGLATVIFLALKLGRPIFLEGEAVALPKPRDRPTATPSRRMSSPKST